jgi:hypothetical protein
MTKPKPLPVIRPDTPAHRAELQRLDAKGVLAGGRVVGRWQVYSPDGLPILPGDYHSEAAARRALVRWAARFTLQGYYRSTRGRIPLGELLAHCRVDPVR